MAVNGVNYRLLRTPRYQGSGLARGVNVLAGLAQSLRYADRVVKGAKPDLVLAGTVYQVDNYPALKIARKHGAVFFRETRDLWPLTLLELGGMKPSHPFVRLVQKAEDYGYQHADMVCTTLEDSFDYMQSHGLDRARWAFTPQCAESAMPEPAPLPEAHRAAFLEARAKGKFIALFAGGFNPYADLMTVIRAAKYAGDQTQFMLVGQGPVKPQMDALIASEGIKNVRILDQIPKGALGEIFSLSDVGLVGFSKARIFNFGISPNKLFDYLAHELPAMLYCDSRKNPVVSSGAGFQIPAEDPKALAEAVRKLMAIPTDARREMGRRGKKFLEQNHHLPKVAARYLEMAEGLLAAKRSRSSR
jgi:glycosyltransferase involved in cell wall biosynthesis